jgi:hypothetical protein
MFTRHVHTHLSSCLQLQTHTIPGTTLPFDHCRVTPEVVDVGKLPDWPRRNCGHPFRPDCLDDVVAMYECRVYLQVRQAHRRADIRVCNGEDGGGIVRVPLMFVSPSTHTHTHTHTQVGTADTHTHTHTRAHTHTRRWAPQTRTHPTTRWPIHLRGTQPCSSDLQPTYSTMGSGQPVTCSRPTPQHLDTTDRASVSATSTKDLLHRRAHTTLRLSLLLTSARTPR